MNYLYPGILRVERNRVAFVIRVRRNSSRAFKTFGRNIPNTMTMAANPIAAPIVLLKKGFL